MNKYLQLKFFMRKHATVAFHVTRKIQLMCFDVVIAVILFL